MSSLSRELVFLILQFLKEEKFKETCQKLEQESGFYFNIKYFEDQVQAGEWDEVERYLSGFTMVDDNRYSMKIFFEIRKQKYLEALDKQDRAKAVEILVKDLRVFSSFNEELYKEMTQLLTLDDFRENEQLSTYGDTKSARNVMLLELKKLIEANPLFQDKLKFPDVKSSRLRTLINQSLNWQHQLCRNPRPNPDIKTLYVDHNCMPSNGARTPANSFLVSTLTKEDAFSAIGAHIPFQSAATHPTALPGWMVNSIPQAPHTVMAVAPSPPVSQPHPDFEDLVKQICPSQVDELVESLQTRIDIAKREKEATEERMRNEENCREVLSMEEALMAKVVQDSRELEKDAETNSKLREFLMDFARMVDILKGRISILTEDVKLLKERMDGGITEIANGYLNLNLNAPPRNQDMDGHLTSSNDNIFGSFSSREHGSNVGISKSRSSTPSDSRDSQDAESLLSSLCQTIDNEEMDYLTTGVERLMVERRVVEMDTEFHCSSPQSSNCSVEAEKQQSPKTGSDDGWQILDDVGESVSGSGSSSN